MTLNSDDAAVADAWVLRMYDTFKPKSIVVGPFDVFHLSSNVFEASARVIEVLIDKPDWRFALAETRSNRNSFHVGRTPRETRQDER